MTVTLLEGHVVDVLASQPANHWHVCVTSPPYLWLRSYSTVPQVWEDGWVGELGQEDTPERYVEHLVAVFRAVKRVLRQDGTLWVNLAGCYFNDPGGQNGASLRNGEGASTLTGANTKNKAVSAISAKAIEANAALGRQKRGRHPWLKPLDWVDVPGLFARAMQQDGWCWRSDVVWVKPSALPESVSGTRWERCRVKVRATGRNTEASKGAHPAGAQSAALRAMDTYAPDAPSRQAAREEIGEWADCPGCPRCREHDGLVLRRGSGRPTKTHEHIQLYTKGPGYYYDTEAVREANTEGSIARFANDPHRVENKKYAGTAGISPAGMNATEWRGNGRNLRDVWTISPEPLADAHYAAYPSELPERCIKAGTSEWGCCPNCGAPWARVVEREPGFQAKREYLQPGHDGRRTGAALDADYRGIGYERSTTLGWRPTCRCPGVAEQAPVPARVLDCFGGSGSTALAANRLGRDCTLIELKSEYAALARKRVGREPLSLFAWKPEDTPEEVEV